MRIKIIIRLIGGLGNQLFQIQYALSLQNKIGGDIEIDDSSFKYSKQLHEKIAILPLGLPYPIKSLSWWNLYIRRSIEKALFKLKLNPPWFLSKLYYFEGCKSKLIVNNKIIIEGFWQDTMYTFTPFLNFLRNKLLLDSNKCLLTDNVCVHIRRTDYLTNKINGINPFNVVSLNYYENGFKYFINKYENSKFDIFTDDEEWVNSKFGARPNIRIILTKKLQPLSILAKMSQYEKFIIANSSLSWWAAVLSVSKNKEVICPPKWTVDTSSEKYRFPFWIIGLDK